MATRPRKGAPLTAGFVESVTEEGVYGDGYGGHGLTLRVKESKYGLISKNWVQRIRIGGRSTNIGIGSFPAVSLREARLAVEKNWLEAKTGRDPRGSGAATLGSVTERVIALHRGSWKNGTTEKQWRNAFANHLPDLMGKRIDRITTADLLEVLAPLVHTKPAMADLVKLRLNTVMEWAVAQKMRPDNPVEVLAAVLPKPKGRTTHHQALPHVDVEGALAKVAGSRAAAATKLAVRFLALTASRTAEVRGAEWSEIEGDIWVIPAERMKASREHRVPLSGVALEVLDEARERWGADGLIFPGKGGNQIGHASVGTLFKRLEIGAPPHGLRQSFRNWCSESGVAYAVSERALAHAVKDATEAAYHTTDLLDARRPVMERWADYIAS